MFSLAKKTSGSDAFWILSWGLFTALIASYWSSVPTLLNRAQEWVKSEAETGPAPYTCQHSYTTEILSIDPLIVYINNFLSDFEVEYLLNQTREKFEESVVYDEDHKSVVDREYRTSQSAMIPRGDPVSECLSRRMRGFLGNVQHIETEPIQVVKYEPGERFRLHTDWLETPHNATYNPARPFRPYNRLGSIFAYLDDDCDGGETYFPEVLGVGESADYRRFSRTESGKGLLVKPSKGNAVFWNNLFSNGSGDPRVLHAGRPVERGRKIGINLFSYYFLDAPFYGGDES